MLGSSMWEMRTAEEVGWFRDTEPETVDILSEDEDEDEGARARTPTVTANWPHWSSGPC